MAVPKNVHDYGQVGLLTANELMESLREAAGTEYDVLGFLGQRGELAFVYLARETASETLVALTLESEGSDESGEAAFSIKVARELDASIPDPETLCPRCRAKLRRWARFCTQCGKDVSGLSATSGPRYSRATLLGAVRSAAGSDYEVLGEMARAEGGGLVYFARDISSGKIVALRLDLEGEEEYSVNVTRVLKPLPKRPVGAPAPARISLVRKMTGEERKYVDDAIRYRRDRKPSGGPKGTPTSDPEAGTSGAFGRRIVYAALVITVLIAALMLAVFI